jgi:hypothetical protein
MPRPLYTEISTVVPVILTPKTARSLTSGAELDPTSFPASPTSLSLKKAMYKPFSSVDRPVMVSFPPPLPPPSSSLLHPASTIPNTSAIANRKNLIHIFAIITFAVELRIADTLATALDGSAAAIF